MEHKARWSTRWSTRSASPQRSGSRASSAAESRNSFHTSLVSPTVVLRELRVLGNAPRLEFSKLRNLLRVRSTADLGAACT